MKPSALGRNLTALAKAGVLDPVVGREREEREILRILCRRHKSNPFLIGPPGVGKTVLGESIAQRIGRGDVPMSLRDRTLYEIRLGSLVAGTKYRGELEQKLNDLLESAVRERMILFIDEIHLLTEAGRGAGMDVANMLKPCLAKGEVTIIGATTVNEGTAFFAQDPALERRFQRVVIEEPSGEQLRQMLLAVRPKLELHHGLQITDEAIETAIEISTRDRRGRSNPDRAIDILEDACAHEQLEIAAEVSAEVHSHPPLQKLEGQLAEARRQYNLARHVSLKQQIDRYIEEHNLAGQAQLRTNRRVDATKVRMLAELASV